MKKNLRVIASEAQTSAAISSMTFEIASRSLP